MKILVNSKINQDSIRVSLGKPEYSYFFLLKEFLPALKRAGDVIVVDSIAEAEERYRQLIRKGQQVVLISVSPPHQTPLHLSCPTVTLFAWEFDRLPDTSWDDNPGNDWRHVFANTAGAICTSRETADLVRQASGLAFPVIALPAPVWNRYSRLGSAQGRQPNLAERFFAFAGAIIDSPILGLSADGLVAEPVADEAPHTPPALEPPSSDEPSPQTVAVTSAGKRAPVHLLDRLLHAFRWRSHRPQRTPEPAVSETPGVILVEPPFRLQVSGVVYTTLLNPGDSRKNWIDIVTAFCWAFRQQSDATLILKMTHHDIEYYRLVLVTLLSRLSPFSCRVVVLHGFMQDKDYAELIDATTFYVNASSGEGLCLPLMEFLSAGVPAIAPTHTAMGDYIDDTLAFTVKCSLEPFCWPHDPTGIFTTHRHRLNWQSLMEAFRASHSLVRETPQQYQQMSGNAWRRMRDHASVKAVGAQLEGFLASVLQPIKSRQQSRRG